MRTSAAVIAILVLAVALAQAGPLDIKQVSADAKWLVHIDVDAMRTSVVLQRLWQRESHRWGDVAARVAAIRDQMCMDPTNDLYGILAYGITPGSPEGVLIVHAAVDRVRFVEKVSKASGYGTGNHRAFPWHGWVQHDGPAICAFFKPDVLVFAKTQAQAANALDVLDGKSPSVPKDHPLVAEAPPSGTILLIRAIGLADATLPFKSPLITHCRSLHIAFGEHQATAFSQINLAVNSPETADRVRTALEGLRAVALLQYETNPSLIKLLESPKVTIAGATVTAATSATADEVWAAIDKTWNQTPETTSKQ